jgi:hypothetical protein
LKDLLAIHKVIEHTPKNNYRYIIYANWGIIIHPSIICCYNPLKIVVIATIFLSMNVNNVTTLNNISWISIHVYVITFILNGSANLFSSLNKLGCVGPIKTQFGGLLGGPSSRYVSFIELTHLKNILSFKSCVACSLKHEK